MRSAAQANQDSDNVGLSANEFAEIQKIIRDITGISMGESKRLLVFRRLTGRLRARGLTDFHDYIDLLKSGDRTEIEAFTNSVTTNLTSFFREKHHFDYLANEILPQLNREKTHKRLRIWSAGCSTGEETYSIAMTLREALPDIRRWDAKLLATDIDSDVLETCKRGIYDDLRVEKIPQSKLKKWFMPHKQDRTVVFEAKDELKKLIAFKQLNLMQDWPMRGKFDVIFCRNVIIYFDKPTQRVLIERYADILEDGGHLILGHSESLHNVSERFSLLGNTIYKKKQ